MPKRFNTTGLCVENKHYMVNIDKKLNKIRKLISDELYFTINRPRQFGKTTTLNELENRLKSEYLVISTSFEGIGDVVFESENRFSNLFLKLLVKSLRFQDKGASDRLKECYTEVSDLEEVSEVLTEFIMNEPKEVILFIDEVDKSSNNQLFLSLLGMLRNKYLLRNTGKDYTFKSVILAGVHDVKTLKLKLRPDEEIKYNSPWNIAVDFDIDMSFSPQEIETMVIDYARDYQLNMNTKALSERIYFFTSGYPYLVSRICQHIDDKLYSESKKEWSVEDVNKGAKILIGESNTLFQSLVKNIENDKELYNLVKRVLVNGENITFNSLDPLINLGIIYGFFINSNGMVKISNLIFEEILYNYMISKTITASKDMTIYNYKNRFITKENGLDVKLICQRFQAYMKENYSSKDKEFIEREGRLLFMAFLPPIINGVGFAWKEVQISEEKRLDVVITYNNFKYIIELKIWRGEKYNEEGLKQLSEYLDVHGLENGYLISFNFNKQKEYKEEIIKLNHKEIFGVTV